MVRLFTYFLPFLVTSYWAVLYLLSKKDKLHILATVALLMASAYYFSSAFYFLPLPDYKTKTILDVITQPIALSLWAFNITIVYEMLKDSSLKPSGLFLLFLPVLIQLISDIIIYSITGIDEASQFFSFWDTAYASGARNADAWSLVPQNFNTSIYHVLVFVARGMFKFFSSSLFFSLLIISLCALKKCSYKFGDLFSYLFLQKRVNVSSLVIVLESHLSLFMGQIIIYGHTFLYDRPYLALLLSILLTVDLFLLSFVTYYRIPVISPVPIQDNKPEPDVPKIKNVVSLSVTDELKARLVKAFEIDKAYLDPALSLEKFASMLSTNRTTLSNLINNHYCKSFKNLLAEFRINESMTYMRENPLASLEDVALHSGFSTSASFYHRFKEFAGDPPRVWLAKQAGFRIPDGEKTDGKS